MLAHVGTSAICRHISALVRMSICAGTCQQADEVQMVGIRGAESDATYWHIPVHVGTYQHMSSCPHVLTHISKEIMFKWLVSEVPRVVSYVDPCRHMSAHAGTHRHMSTCPRVLTHVSMEIRSNGWYQRCRV